MPAALCDEHLDTLTSRYNLANAYREAGDLACGIPCPAPDRAHQLARNHGATARLIQSRLRLRFLSAG